MPQDAYVVMQWLGGIRLRLQGVPHEVPIEEDSGRAESCLGEFEHHAHLQDEVDAFTP